MNLILFLALVGYVLYILIIRPIIINAKFGKDKIGIILPDGIDDSIKLMEYLRMKNFTYPELINMRHNELGQVVIEGKYTSHALIIEGQTLFVDRGKKGSTRKQTNCILEAVIIGHYLTKLFNPNAPVDAYKQFTSFKKRRWQPTVITASLLCLIIIFAIFASKDKVVPQFSSNNISVSYLSEYSTKVTVGDAFNKFFSDPKWKSYEQGIQKYVDFQGGLMRGDEPVTAVITFSISGEKFKVESVKIDNEKLSTIEVQSFFEAVYGESKEQQVSSAISENSSVPEETNASTPSSEANLQEPTENKVLNYEDPDNSLNEVSLTVYGNNEVTGDISINTIQDKTAFIEFNGVLKNGVVEASFEDDGWGESGTIQLTVNENSATLNIEVSPNDNSSGWGVTSGTYMFKKVDG